MRYWFTADTHLGHDNIRIRCKRPFLTIEEMDNTIINNWNKLVNGDDMVYILGDFTFGSCPCEKITNYIKRLLVINAY
jgi:calcineurin-like phosphoesterase family protein